MRNLSNVSDIAITTISSLVCNIPNAIHPIYIPSHAHTHAHAHTHTHTYIHKCYAGLKEGRVRLGLRLAKSYEIQVLSRVYNFNGYSKQ